MEFWRAPDSLPGKPEVMRDTRMRVQLPGEQVSAEGRAEWGEQAARFVETVGSSVLDVPAVPQKLQRLTAFDGADAVDWML